MVRRTAAKVDGNHTEIAEAFRLRGCTVQSLAALGGGVPDLLVGVSGHNVLIEVKDPVQPPSKQRLNALQKEFHRNWLGRVLVVQTEAQVDIIVQFYRSQQWKVFL